MSLSENIRDLPIGVFDSGLGGLTVVQELRKTLKSEHIIYLGDSARVPYGTRSKSTVEKYAYNCARLLVDKGLKMLVVACNTASAVALPKLKEKIDVPVLGVIRAGALEAVRETRNGKIGVIGTAGTIGSGAYVKEIGEIDPGLEVYQNPAPLLVPLAEEGWLEGDVPTLVVRRYIEPLTQKGIDVLLLGCTHYPILMKSIQQVLEEMGSSIRVINSAVAMAAMVKDALVKHEIAQTKEVQGKLSCYVTDLPQSFAETAARFLGEIPQNVEEVDIL